MPILTARTLITAIGTVAYPAITIDSAGLITDISSEPGIRSEAVLTPAFLDIHTHGAAGHDVMSADRAGLSVCANFLAQHGVAHFLPTTVTAPIDETLAALDRLAAFIEAGAQEAAAQPIGIHLEGPFLSHAKRGVHPAEMLQPASIKLFDRFRAAARGHIKLLTLAPELPGAVDLTAHAVAQGVCVSLGHTNASAAEAQAAIAAGASSATHTFNAMRPLDHRDPGVLGPILAPAPDTPSLYAELICDGIHVHPALVRLWLRAKGDHAILVTDSIAATGLPDGPSTLAGLPVTVANGRASLTGSPGTLAGSVLTLDRAVRNLRSYTDCPLETAVRCASSQPAAMLGLADSIASVRVGQPAHFNQYTADGRLEATYLHGRRVAL